MLYSLVAYLIVVCPNNVPECVGRPVGREVVVESSRSVLDYNLTDEDCSIAIEIVSDTAPRNDLIFYCEPEKW